MKVVLNDIKRPTRFSDIKFGETFVCEDDGCQRVYLKTKLLTPEANKNTLAIVNLSNFMVFTALDDLSYFETGTNCYVVDSELTVTSPFFNSSDELNTPIFN